MAVSFEIYAYQLAYSNPVYIAIAYFELVYFLRCIQYDAFFS
ncbi:MAG: hypothetical protein ETSY1_03750 [Candidatus Entotheonella factor]|uniref:Uncharacterized protein n=1 Tax=Entotheonella factor TaxID=1429438 RepID=W4LXB6_ENTF1|nr:MAG: hypothetical protein ETSY1_03750 [Candidatus Entotheonella factor]